MYIIDSESVFCLCQYDPKSSQEVIVYISIKHLMKIKFTMIQLDFFQKLVRVSHLAQLEMAFFILPAKFQVHHKWNPATDLIT